MRPPKYMIIVSPIETDHPLRGQEIEVYKRGKTGNLIPCDGEAHSNARIDDCSVCAPRWGKVEEDAPVDFEAARALGAIDVCDLSDPEIGREQREHGGKLLTVNRVVRRTRKTVSSYMVVTYPTLRTPTKAAA